jgi:DNA-binding MarR family transcriptional regulator
LAHAPVNSSLASREAEAADAARRWIELAERLLLCGRMLRGELTRQLGRWQLSEPAFSVLWFCRQNPPGGISQSDLVAGLAVSPAQVSGLVEQLRQAGLLRDHQVRTDRRRKFWRLTAAGEARLVSIVSGLAEWASDLNGRLPAVDSAEIVGLLDQLAAAMRIQIDGRRPTATGQLPPESTSVRQHAFAADCARRQKGVA